MSAAQPADRLPAYRDSDHIASVSVADKRLHRALLVCRRRNVRTSQGTFISRHEDQDGVLAWVEDKIALLSGIPAGHGEVCRPYMSLER